MISRYDYLKKFNPDYKGETVTWFTSDLHLNDTRMFTSPPTTVHYRPQFNSLEEMNHAIVDSINHFVNEHDVLYILGDVFCSDLLDGIECFNQIKCKHITLIAGNHDYNTDLGVINNILIEKCGFSPYNINNRCIIENTYIKANPFADDSDIYYMCHYPIKAKLFIEQKYNCYALVGHIHGAWRIQPKIINVGIDAWGFRPVSLYEINFVVNAMKKGYLDQEVYPYLENYKNILNIE